jgi:uncharacterized protein DUF1622
LVRYGRWLVAGLTFQLAADIIGTSIAPSCRRLGSSAPSQRARRFIEQLWEYDQIVFDATGPH